MANYKVGDYIRLMRNAYDMSQEELAFRAGIATETISRIENGKHKITQNVYRKIMEVFIFFPQQFYGICTDNDIEVLDIKQTEADAEAKFEYKKAKEYLEILKPKVKDTLVNQQYLLRAEAVLDYCTEKIDVQEMLEKLKNALSLTIVDFEKILMCEEICITVYPFTEQEILIMLNIADAYGKLKEHKQDERIKRMLLNCLQSTYIDGKGIDDLKLVIKRNLAKTLMRQKKYDEVMELLSQVFIDAKTVRNGIVLSLVLYEMAWTMKKINSIEEKERFKEDDIKRKMRQAYYIAAARNDDYVYKIIKEEFFDFYKENIEFSDE